jgi:hypothetical protein
MVIDYQEKLYVEKYKREEKDAPRNKQGNRVGER